MKIMKANKRRILLRTITGLIIFAMILGIFSCSTTDSQNNNDSAVEDNNLVADEQQEPETEELQSPIPQDVKFGGEEIRILNCTYFSEELAFINVEEENGDIVNDSLYRRNQRVQSDLDVNFKFIDIALQASGDFGRMVRNSVTSGSDDYDMLFGVQYDAVQLSTAGVFANLRDVPYINLDNPWWPSKNIQEELTIGKDTLYFLTGDISLNFVRNMGCAYFNKQVYEDNFGNPDDMYKTVLDGKWTMDKFAEMVKPMYKDLNGDGTSDDGDQYGCAVITSNITDHLTYAAGVRVTERDENGIPYFVMNNERTVSFVEKLHNLFYANEGVTVFVSAEETNLVKIPEKFMRNELLFVLGWFYTSELLRNMPADYGIIPYPKYDEAQPTYLSLAHDIVPLYCVPTTCTKPEAVGAILEAMSFESYKTLLPAYYEIALKLKYTRDTVEDAFTIIDMIHDNCTTDFAYVYNYSLNNIGLIMRDLMGSKSSDFVSKYEKSETRIQTSLEKIVDAYLGNE